MKRYINHIKRVCCILIALASLSSCKENVFQADDFKTGIYFITDSIDYSFGITPLETKNHRLDIPVRIMGNPSSQDREFNVELLVAKTDAEENIHYKIPTSFLVKADSVNGIIPLEILRESLGNANYKIAFNLLENGNFVPTSKETSSTVITFNNRIEQPHWVNPWANDNVRLWPSSQLGPWNPMVYVKFVELVNEVEGLAPGTYMNMMKDFGGPLLPKFPGTWAYDYNNTLTKYVLIPLYRYFIIDHKELGVKGIPKPAGFIN
ncbi:DUF4843 domain-containing protein [Sphingobacterium bovistauri]|uniref:DUF4843 domain-containing protein n=1 Tax=Sphingobacterium bovistauri TaxID=2781959 RepID=A0ABS7Z2D8_9SPHI|nr:DUF4843 domain-containing protein [Sphingobacterium bovistauri]MCA5004318.1 DUF4843 domain-containing protein [Sphingobacterium bovistauri]